jgi:hypothetical protein
VRRCLTRRAERGRHRIGRRRRVDHRGGSSNFLDLLGSVRLPTERRQLPFGELELACLFRNEGRAVPLVSLCSVLELFRVILQSFGRERRSRRCCTFSKRVSERPRDEKGAHKVGNGEGAYRHLSGEVFLRWPVEPDFPLARKVYQTRRTESRTAYS